MAVSFVKLISACERARHKHIFWIRALGMITDLCVEHFTAIKFEPNEDYKKWNNTTRRLTGMLHLYIINYGFISRLPKKKAYPND